MWIVKFKKIFNYLTIILLVLLLFITLSTRNDNSFNKNNELVYVFGLSLLTVITESMQPVIEPGDMIIINSRQINQANIGDIITYKLETGSLVTHRIIDKKIISGKIIYQLQGDANSLPDHEWVPQEDILGIYQLRLNKLGHITEFLRSPFLLIIILALMSMNRIFAIIRSQIAMYRRKWMKK